MTGNHDPGQHIFWLASRAFGVTALVLVALSVGLGLTMASKIVKSPGAPARIKQLHEATALTALLAIAAHGVLLLGDSYLRPGLTGITIPFTMPHRPAWTGLGVIGGWLAAILGLTFYARKWIGPKLWRQMHRWTLAVYVLAVIHALGAGTDARSVWLLLILGLTALPIALLAAVRFLPDEPREPPRPPKRVLSPPLPGTEMPAAGSRR